MHRYEDWDTYVRDKYNYLNRLLSGIDQQTS